MSIRGSTVRRFRWSIIVIIIIIIIIIVDAPHSFTGTNPTPAAGPEPDGTGTEPTDEPTDEPTEDMEPWACETDPAWPPCAVCLDPDATEQMCADAWWNHCASHPEESWCQPEGDPPDAVFAPSSLSLLVYQVAVSQDAEGCTDPVVVGEPDTPQYVDFFGAPELIVAQIPAPGEYPCVLITMSDHIQWSVEGDSACAGLSVQDVSGEDGLEETKTLYLSTAASASDSEYIDPWTAPGIHLDSAMPVGDAVLSSTFVVAFPDGVHMHEQADGTADSDMQEPRFGFETSYAE